MTGETRATPSPAVFWGIHKHSNETFGLCFSSSESKSVLNQRNRKQTQQCDKETENKLQFHAVPSSFLTLQSIAVVQTFYITNTNCYWLYLHRTH